MNENSEEKEENLPEHSQSNSLKELDEVLTFDIYIYLSRLFETFRYDSRNIGGH